MCAWLTDLSSFSWPSCLTWRLDVCRLPEALVPAIVARLSLRDVDALRRTCRASRQGVDNAQDELQLQAQVYSPATRSPNVPCGVR